LDMTAVGEIAGGAVVTGYGGVVSISSYNNFGKNYDRFQAASEGPGGGGINRIPNNDSQINHIFQNKEGHLPDTPGNRRLLENTANNKSNYLGSDKYGNDWYAKTQPDGTQVWVETRNGKIIDGGLNNSPKSYNSNTGLKSQI